MSKDWSSAIKLQTDRQTQIATSLCKTLSHKTISKLVPRISKHPTARGIILYISLESRKIYGKYIMCIRRVSLIPAAATTTTVLNVPRSDKHPTSYTRHTRRNASWFSRRAFFLSFFLFVHFKQKSKCTKTSNTSLHIKIKKKSLRSYTYIDRNKQIHKAFKVE